MLFFLLICFGFSAMCFYVLSAAQNPCTLGNRLMSVVGQYVVNIFVYLAVQGILKFTDHSNLNKNRRVKFGKAGSCNWTRRRAYWLQKSVSRADYLCFARRSRTLSANSFMFKAAHTTCTHEQPTATKISATCGEDTDSCFTEAIKKDRFQCMHKGSLQTLPLLLYSQTYQKADRIS